MKNYGLSDYSAIVSRKFKNLVEIFINPIQETWNTHYIIPLYKSKYKKGLDFSLIYNHQDMWTDYNFGKGMKLNFDIRVVDGDSKYPYYIVKPTGQKFGLTLTKEDSSIFYYQYENKELNIMFTIYRDNFNLYYKDGTILNMIGLNGYIGINRMTKKDGTIITYQRDSNGRFITISNNALKTEKLQFQYDSDTCVILNVYKTTKTGELSNIKSIKLMKENSGTFNGFINNILISQSSNNDNYIKNISFTHLANGSGLQTYKIIDNLTELFCEIQINSSNATYYYQDEMGRKTTFSYDSQYCATVTNYNGESFRLHTDSTSRLISITNLKRKKVNSFSYNDDNKIIQSSKTLNYNPLLNGKVLNMKYDTVNSFATKQDIETPSLLSDYYSVSKAKRVSLTNEEGKYVQVYEVSGYKFDTYSLGLWSKLISASSFESYLLVDIYFTNSLSDYYLSKKISKSIKIFSKDDIHEYEFYMMSAYSLQTYKYVVVEFKAIGADIESDLLIDLYQKGMTTIYEYDNDGNQITKLNSSKITEVVYNSDNTIASTNYTNYSYDEKGNVIKTVNPFGKQEFFEYDSSNNLLKHTITDGTRKIETSNSYIDEETLLMQCTDTDISTEYETDNLYNNTNKKNVYDDNDNVINNIVQYNQDNQKLIDRKEYRKNNISPTSTIGYTYDISKNVKVINHNNSKTLYENIFDQYGRNIGLKVNDINFITNNFKKFDDLPTELLEYIKFSNKDMLIYHYDDLDRIESVSYKSDIDGIERLLFTYYYDDNDRLISMNDSQTNTTYLYHYDDNGFLDSFSYTYNDNSNLEFIVKKVSDVDGNPNFKKIKTPNEILNISVQTIFKSLNVDFNEYKKNIRNTPGMFLCMFDEYPVKYKNNDDSETYIKYEQFIKLLNTVDRKCYTSSLGNVDSEYCEKDGFITYYRSNYNNGFTFEFVEDSPLGSNQSIAFSVMPLSSFGDSTLLKLDDNSNTLKLSINSSGNIILKENDSTIITTSKTYSYSDYHFICFTYDINEKTAILKVDDDLYNAQLTLNYNQFIKLSFIELLACKMTNIIIPYKAIIDELECDYYFKSFNYLISLNQSRKDSNNNIVKKSSKKFMILPSYCFIPLNNGTVGVNENDEIIYPLEDEVLELQCLASKNSEFIYNDDIEDFAYYSMGQKLSYDVGLSNSGSICVNVNRLFVNDENVVVDLIDTQGFGFALSILNEKIRISFDGTNYDYNHDSLLSEKNKWNVLSITWNKLVTSGSMTSNLYNFCVYINKQKIVDVDLPSQEVLGDLVLYVGRYLNPSTFGNCFNGLFENLIYTSTQLSLSQISEIVDIIQKQNKVVREYDNLDLLQKYKVKDSGNTILENDYTYQTNDDDNSIVKMIIINELINEDSYDYSYDKMKNISSISKNGNIISSYIYDELGRLINEIVDNVEYSFVYDSNGNIKNVTKCNEIIISMDYAGSFNDKLIKVNNDTISYDLNNPFNPISIGDNITLKYEGRNLVEYSDTLKSIYNKYYYNNAGYRVLKQELFSNQTVKKATYYYYDESNRLIYQDDGVKKLTFIYDDLGQVYGFIYNGNRFYYIKNILNTILGIVDHSGNVVVRYNYDSWGNILSVEDLTSYNLSSINPIKYKAYYFDEDINMYYCKSRYYVPQWRRWLNADNPNYLDCGNTNSLNLYSYCGNNPVSRYDGVGYFWNIVAGAIIGAVINVAVTVATSIITKEPLDVVDVLISAGSGAIDGALTAAGVPPVVSLFVNGTVNSAINIYEESKDLDGVTFDDVGKSIAEGFMDEFVSFGIGSTKIGKKLFGKFEVDNIKQANELYDEALKELRDQVIGWDMFESIAKDTGDIVMKEVKNGISDSFNSAVFSEVYDGIKSYFKKDN